MVQIDGFVVIGTYKLDEAQRSGTIVVYDSELNILSTTPAPSAILDISYYEEKLFCAHSTGIVSVWAFKDSNVEHIHDVKFDDELVLQFDFRDRHLAATTTSGSLYYYDLEKDILKWDTKSHDLEPWCVRFGEHGIWTGGDDQALCFHDFDGNRLMKFKHHDAGVTSILPLENAIWTGGYDDNLRIMDLRTRRQVDNLNLGGGVWRLIPDPQQPKQILTCCMYNGLAILDHTSDLQLPTVRETQTNVHESMVYGGCWMNDTPYTCSFYDCRIQKMKI